MRKNKTDQTINGPLNKRHTNIVPKGYRSHYIEGIRAYILVSKEATSEAIMAQVEAFTSRYRKDLSGTMRLDVEK
jgi:hypothetical protein